METELQPDLDAFATDYTQFVLRVLPQMTRDSRLDQAVLRHCILLSSSFLVTDTTTQGPDHGMFITAAFIQLIIIPGMNRWSVGFLRLMDIVIALHAKSELELETLNASSKACSECWTVGNSWPLPGAHDTVRKIAVKLKRLLDENGRTYRGERIYAP